MTDEQKLREQLAAIEHERWADWQRYVHGKLIPQRIDIDGAGVPFTMRKEDHTHWEQQIATPYAELSEAEKDSDRKQVDRYWPLVQAYTDARVLEEATKYCDDGHYHDNERDVAMLPSERLAELKQQQGEQS